MDKKDNGSIILPNASSAAIWEHEVTGQISDGKWENSGPRDHWQFWGRLAVKVQPGVTRVEHPRRWECKRWYYGLSSLYNLKWDASEQANGGKVYVLRDRMVNLGRIATAAEKTEAFTGSLFATAEEKRAAAVGYEQRIAAEEMPDNYEAFKELAATNERFRKAVSNDLAFHYYMTSYGIKELKRDVAFIKAAMETMK
jgi:hypothetical protein